MRDSVKRPAGVPKAPEDAITFDDILTGEISLQNLAVKATPTRPAPIPYADVADVAGAMPSTRAIRHARDHQSSLFWGALLASVPASALLVWVVATLMQGGLR